MATEMLELLDPTKHYKLFTVIGLADKDPLALVTEEEAKFDYRITGKTIVRGDGVSAGALHGIDQDMWEKGREYTVTVFISYELRPLPVQEGEPGLMLTPEGHDFRVLFGMRSIISRTNDPSRQWVDTQVPADTRTVQQGARPYWLLTQ